MTDPLSPEEIEEKRAVPEDYGAIGLSRGTYFRLLDIAEDHARLVAENAKLRERVEKLEAAGATVLRGFDEGAFVRDVRGDHDPAWAIKLLPYLDALAALAACEEEEGS